MRELAAGTARVEVAEASQAPFQESVGQFEVSSQESFSNDQRHRQSRIGSGSEPPFNRGYVRKPEHLFVTAEPKSTYHSVMKSARRKARCENLKTILLRMVSIIIVLLMAIAILSFVSIFKTEIDSILRFADRHDIALSKREVMFEALKHSTPWDAVERMKEYNIFFDLSRYQYLMPDDETED